MDLLGNITQTDEPVDVTMARRLRDGSTQGITKPTQRESSLSVFVNGIPTMRIGCSASQLAELVCGRLFTQGLVRSAAEIASVELLDDPLRAIVTLVGREADLSRHEAPAVLSATSSYDTVNSYFDTGDPLQAVRPIAWDDEWVFRVAEVFERDDTMHSRTWGSHSAYLADRSGVLYLCEDLGRHNAFDKAIGCALRDGVDLTRCLLFTSGRVPTDMTVKAVRAGLPLLVSKAVATDRAIALACRFNLTLICRASSRSFDIVNGPSAEASV